jgi:hypothetical protein
MKIHELLQEEDTPFHFIKGLSNKFKALAAEYGITLVAGMGWPRVGAKGGWIGGGLGQKGGSRAKDAGVDDDDINLPIEIRTKGFLAAATLMLQDLINNGHTVMVSVAADPASSKIPVDHDSVGQVLRASLKTATPPASRGILQIPCVAWFVSLPPALLGTANLTISIAAHAEYLLHQDTGNILEPSSEPLRAFYFTPMNSKTAGVIGKRFAAFKRQNAGVGATVNGRWTQINQTQKWLDFQDEMFKYVLDSTDQKFPPKVSGVYIDVSKTVAIGKYFKRIESNDPLLSIIGGYLA